MSQNTMHTRALPCALAALGIALSLTACSILTPQADPTRYFALQASSSGRIASTARSTSGTSSTTTSPRRVTCTVSLSSRK